MGSVLTPAYVGLEKTLDLPQAATLCGECHVVCPMKIPLPDLLRKLRERQFERGLRPWSERLGLALWGYVARRPTLYRWATRAGSQMLRWMGGPTASIRRLPGAGGWTDHRNLSAPSAKPFRHQWAEGRRPRS
jgi:L-lactate dehydrogenase complex protein LldF